MTVVGDSPVDAATSTAAVAFKRPYCAASDGEADEGCNDLPLQPPRKRLASTSDEETLEHVHSREDATPRTFEAMLSLSTFSVVQLVGRGQLSFLGCSANYGGAPPPDFGGRVAEMLWGVRVEFSSAVEYLLLQARLSEEERQQLPGARRVASPELKVLARCSRAVRRAIVVAAATRRRTIEPSATDQQRRTCVEICDMLRNTYPQSWSYVGPSIRESIACEISKCGFPVVTVP